MYGYIFAICIPNYMCFDFDKIENFLNGQFVLYFPPHISFLVLLSHLPPI